MNLLAALLLTPLLHEDGELRLVSDGTGDVPVTWVLDGDVVASTVDGVPATINATAGSHRLWAHADVEREWTAMARPDASVPGQATYVPAWSATQAAQLQPEKESWLLPVGFAAVGAALVLWPKHP